MYIEKLTIRNFRCFAKTEIELQYPGRRASKNNPVPERLRNVNLFIGENGSGKTSVFRAAILGVLAPIIRLSGFQAELLVRRAAGEVSKPNIFEQEPVQRTAAISTYLRLGTLDTKTPSSNSNRIVGQTVIKRIGDFEDVVSTAVSNSEEWEQIFLNNSLAFFLVGYGASRRMERPEGYSEQSRSPRYQHVASLFEDHVGLVPFTYAYLTLKEYEYLEEARSILNQALPPEISLTDKIDGLARPLFDWRGILLPYNALSDGFRAFVGWIWDLLFQIARLVGRYENRWKLTDAAGVVIVDEIDLFLHPEWQRFVVERVAETFPDIQFLFSTHSALVAGTLEPENIFVLDTDQNGNAVVEQYREDIYGQSANQILTSSYFRLPTTRAPGAQVEDIARLALSEETSDRDEFLKRMTQSIPREGLTAE